MRIEPTSVERVVESSSDQEVGSDLRAQQLGHDLQHGLATVAVLAEAISGAAGLDPEATERLRHLKAEVRRLATLLEEELHGVGDPDADATVRIDLAAREVCQVLAGTTTVEIRLQTEPVRSSVGLTGLWRALRNLLDNAIRAAPGAGAVEVRVFNRAGLAVMEVDDSGPGFGQVAGGIASLGLGIVQDFVSRHDGTLEIETGSLGGCCVRISLVAVPLLGLVESLDLPEPVVEPARGPETAH